MSFEKGSEAVPKISENSNGERFKVKSQVQNNRKKMVPYVYVKRTDSFTEDRI